MDREPKGGRTMNASAGTKLTLVRDAIQRPEEPRHFMVMRTLPGVVSAYVEGTLVARSDRAFAVKEVAGDVLDPVIYFPPGDVEGPRVVPAQRTSSCPLKGSARYLDVVVADGVVKEAAWSYQEVRGFDPRLSRLEGSVAFDASKVVIEVESIAV
jgi:uncharacterized protein (DUF427 family)